MKENVAYLLGIVAGLAAVGIICWVKKRGRKEADYDERQYQTRDRACRYGFLTLLLYELVYGALYMKEAPVLVRLYDGKLSGNWSGTACVRRILYLERCLYEPEPEAVECTSDVWSAGTVQSWNRGK